MAMCRGEGVGNEYAWQVFWRTAPTEVRPTVSSGYEKRFLLSENEAERVI